MSRNRRYVYRKGIIMFIKHIGKVDRFNAGIIETAIIVMFALFISQPSAQAKAKATQVFELLKDAEQFEWTDLSGNSIQKGQLNYGVTLNDGLKRGGRFGTPVHDEVPYFDPNIKEPVIDIEIAPAEVKGARGVKAVWENRLPIAKMITAEFFADVLLNSKNEEPNAKILLRVEVWDKSVPGGWSTEAVFDPAEQKIEGRGGLLPIRSVAEEKFRTYSLIADLSEWSGEYVRLSFEIQASPLADETIRARWLKARLVSANFSVKLIDDSEPVINTLQLQKNETKDWDVETSGGEDYIFVENAANYPDTSLTIDEYDNHTIGYYAGDSGSVGKSTMVFDRGTGSFSSGCSVEDVTSSTVRIVSGTFAVNSESGNQLWAALQPVTSATDYQLDNHYSGVAGVIAGLIDGTTEVLHGVVHDEDKYDEGPEKEFPIFWRIGYVRTRNNYDDYRDAYTFYRMTHANGEYLPAGECPQDAGWGHAIIAPAYTEADARAVTNKPATWHIGTSNPDIVADEWRYYCFHTYWDMIVNASQELITPASYGISIASCYKSELDVPEEDYRSANNPWDIYSKYYDEFRIGPTGLRTGYDVEDWIVLFEYVAPVVSWNDEIDEWVMFCEHSGTIYMLVSDVITSWDEESVIPIKTPGGSTLKYYHQSLVGTSDKLTHSSNELYYMKITNATPTSNDNMYRHSLLIEEH